MLIMGVGTDSFLNKYFIDSINNNFTFIVAIFVAIKNKKVGLPLL